MILMKQNLFGMALSELQLVSKEAGLPVYAAKQMADWLYVKRVGTIEEMTNISRQSREKLAENYETGVHPPLKVQVSGDGTKKYLFPAGEGKYIETAMIPENERNTVCVSSQAGCKFGCLFCMTGRQGFLGQLSAGEIVNQIRSIDEAGKVSNIVYMGMGEPFDNPDEVMKSLEILSAPWGFAMSPHRITVSTIGIIPGMRRFLDESEAHLAVSLHSPFDEERRQLMPVQAAYPIADVIREIRSRDFNHQRRVSFEYIVFKDLNTTYRHVRELARLLNGLKCRINLIRFHSIPGSSLMSSDEESLAEFKDLLNEKGILTTIRASRGVDIDAACGLLSTKESR
jgi:23S rRNA (adenine2503-C2)-methyltransferase